MDVLNEYGGMALTGIFLLCVVVGLIFGAARGWKRSLLRFALIIACIVLATVLAPVVYNNILETDLSVADPSLSGTPADMIADLTEGIISEGSIKDLPAVWQLVIMLPSLFVNLLLFVILFAVLRFWTWILFGLLKLFLFSKDRQARKEYKKYKTKKVYHGGFLGMGIGVVQGMAIALAFLVPVAALANTAQIMVQNVDTELISEESEYYEIITYMEEAYSIYTKSVPGSIYSGIGVDKLIYEPLTTVKVGDDKFTMEDIGEVAGIGLNFMLKFDEVSTKLSEDDSEANFKIVYADFFNYLDTHLEDFFDNKLVVILLNGIGEGITDGTITLFEESSDPDVEPDYMLLAITEMLTSVASDMASNLKADLLDIIGIMRDLNNNGTLYALVNSMDDFTSIIDDQDSCIQLGKALDTLLQTNLLSVAKESLFSFLGESMLAPIGDELGFDLSEIKLHNVNWEGAMVTVYKGMNLVSDMAESTFDMATLGTRVTDLIDSLGTQLVGGQDVTGIIGAFEGFVKNTIADMDLQDIDNDFLANKNLDIINNSDEIGAMLNLMNDQQLFISLSESAAALSGEASDDIAKLRVHLTGISTATTDFKQVINGVIGSIMGVNFDAAGDAIGTMIRALDAFDLVIKAQGLLPPGGIPTDPGQLPQFTATEAEELVKELLFDEDGIVDGTVLDMLESFVPDVIDLGEHQDLVKDTLKDLKDEMISELAQNTELDQEAKDAILQQYDRLADLLGIDLTAGGTPPIPPVMP